MSESRYFNENDCSAWLYQSLSLYNNAMRKRFYPLEMRDKKNTMMYLDQSDVITPEATLATSMVLMMMFVAQTLHQKQRFGYAHLILGTWMLLQIPPVVSFMQLPSEMNYSTKQKYDVWSYISIHLLIEQMITLTMVMLLWLTIGRLKRVEVQVVSDDQETTYGIFKKLRFLRIYQWLFILMLPCFQVPMSIHGYFEMQYYQLNKNYEPQNYEESIVRLAELVDWIVIFLFVSICINLAIQLSNFIKLLHFLVSSIWIRLVLYTSLVVFVGLYIHEVALTLFYNWGMPAFEMTQQSYDFALKKYINKSTRCTVFFDKDIYYESLERNL